MNFLGITAEYNPFHNGHRYHIEKSREDLSPDATVIVMSGNFTQRGSCACYDKWTRAKCALLSGADLVVELPATFATGSAERFAFGSICLLNEMGVKYVSFGSESEFSKLDSVADKLLSDEFKISSPSETAFHIARQEAVCDTEILSKPNNILAIEYLKALKIVNSSVLPHRIGRHHAGYNDTVITDSFASATTVRNLIKNGNNYAEVIPDEVYELLTRKEFTDNEKFFDIIKYAIISKTPEELAEYAHIREGIENRIYKCAFGVESLDDLIKDIKSKRYTYTSVSRMLISILLGIKKVDLPPSPGYIRVLGLNDKGAKALKHIRQHSSLPVISKLSSDIGNLTQESLKELEFDLRASDIYYSCANLSTHGRPDYINSPIKI